MAETIPTPRDGAAPARPMPPPTDRLAARRAQLWAVLHDDAASQGDHFAAWLALQCEALAGANGGLLLLRGTDASHVQATWPAGRDPADLQRLAERCLAEARAVVAWGRSPQPGAMALFIAQPLGPDGTPNAAVAVTLTVPGGIERADPDAIGRQLRAAAGWIDAWRWRQPLAAANTRIGIAATALDILAATGEHRGLTAAGMALVNSMATRLGCDRVSLGLARHRGMVLQSVSNAAEFQAGARIADAIEDAMDEALTQNHSLVLPEPADSPRRVLVAHRALHAASGHAGGLLSVPLPGPGGRPAAVLTLERQASPFTPEETHLAEAVAALTGPLIGLHADERRWISGRARDLAETGLRALFGPARPALKLATALILLALVALSVVTGEYRVTARAVVEGEIQRAAVAPFDGYIRTAPARAGDTVKAGDILATLDDRDLVLDRLKWTAEREKLAQKHREALAKGERATLGVLAAQLAQADAELSLAEEKLARSRITAPFDAIVVSGDLRQMLGSPIERGKVLFELAPLDAWRLVIQADEREVRWLAAGQTGLVALAAMPIARLKITVARITPVATAEDGRNFFRIEARLDAAETLRPGMEGIAKIETGPQRLIWIWTHAMLDWLRLFAWHWLP
jgi:multidrug efflux pump subunit AcrA (membrane-fusion protein)